MALKTYDDNRSSQGRWVPESATLHLPEQSDFQSLAKQIKQSAWLTLPVARVDFSEVKKADSATLSLLLFWAKQQHSPLEVIDLPEQMKTLIDLYDMKDVLQVSH